eukprot:6435344-Amphidinium_carterae.2
MSVTDCGDAEEDDIMCARDSDFGLSDRQTEALLAKHAAGRRSSRGLGFSEGCPEEKVIELEQRVWRLQKLEEVKMSHRFAGVVQWLGLDIGNEDARGLQ